MADAGIRTRFWMDYDLMFTQPMRTKFIVLFSEPDFMHTEHHIATHTLFPTKRQILRTIALLLLLSLISGLLLGLLMFNAPHSALALALGDLFVVGGSAVFSAPGGALLVFWASLIWGLGFAMIAAFFYVARLLYLGAKDQRNHARQKRMAAYCSAIEGKPPE